MAQSPGAVAVGTEMQALETTMAEFLQPNNDVRKAAEARLKVLLRQPTSTGLLLQVASTSSFPQVRVTTGRLYVGPLQLETTG